MVTTSGSDAVNVALAEAAALATGPGHLVWQKRVSEIFWINSAAISRDGSRMLAATFVHDYRQRTGKFLPNVLGHFGTYCFDTSSPTDAAGAPLQPLWSDEFDGWDGVFGVGISGDGTVAASAGWLDKTGNTVSGFVRAYSAADGKRLLDCTNFSQRVSWVGLSDDGAVLAAVSDDVYVFVRDRKAFNPVPLRLGVGGRANRYVTGLAVHPSGTWLAACDQCGNVYVATIRNGAITGTFVWSAPSEIPFLSVAIASTANAFVVGGGNSVFLFTLDGIRNARDPLIFDTTLGQDPATIPPNKPDGRLQENVRWVAISDNGSLISAVANRLDKTRGTGLLVALTVQGGQLTRLWQQGLDNNPNSTSIDAAGKFVAASDGYPTSTPSKFYLFDATTPAGNKLWDFGTFSMNWPIVISADASAIAAGSDDGTLYYFKP